MAQIKEEVIKIKISRLVKNGVDIHSAVTDTVTTTIESVVQELIGDDAVVEIVQEEG